MELRHPENTGVVKAQALLVVRGPGPSPGRNTAASACVASLSRFGGHSTSKTPDPVPISEVKCRRANGTAS